jgi:hypothetical protein
MTEPLLIGKNGQQELCLLARMSYRYTANFHN